MISARPTLRRTARNVAIVGASAVASASLAVSHASAQSVNCGDTITNNTKLTSNLVDCPSDGVVIGAPNITLDLQGYMIDGDESSSTLGDGVANSGGYDRVTIKNGSIRQFVEGVSLENANRNRLSKLRVSRNEAGIELADSDDNRIERIVAVGNEEGIGLGEAIGGNGSDGNLIEKNSAVDNMVEGIALENGAEKNRVTRNVAFLNGFGILVDSVGSEQNVIDRNVANTNLQDGIYVGEPTTVVRRNTANNNVDYGIDAFFGAIDRGGNKARGNGNAAQCLNVVCS